MNGEGGKGKRKRDSFSSISPKPCPHPVSAPWLSNASKVPPGDLITHLLGQQTDQNPGAPDPDRRRLMETGAGLRTDKIPRGDTVGCVCQHSESESSGMLRSARDGFSPRAAFLLKDREKHRRHGETTQPGRWFNAHFLPSCVATW